MAIFEFSEFQLAILMEEVSLKEFQEEKFLPDFSDHNVFGGGMIPNIYFDNVAYGVIVWAVFGSI